MTAAILCFITALLCAITVNEACKCAVVHPQTNFCNADFAIRAKVLSESRNNSRVYTVKILKTFKGAKEITGIIASQVKGTGKRKDNSKVARVTTELDSAACGVSLEQSKTYVLLGYIDKKKLRIDSCQWHALWTSITGQQRRGLKKLYGQNCDCRIEKYCFKPSTETCDDMIDGCNTQDADPAVGFCKRKNAYCKKLGDECKWIITKKAFQKCLKNN